MPSNPSTPSRVTTTTSTSDTATLELVQAGVRELHVSESTPVTHPPPTLPSSLTPAPVTVVRTPGPPQPFSNEQPPGAQFSVITGSPTQTPAINVPSSQVGGVSVESQQQLEYQQQLLTISGQQQPSPMSGGPTAYRMTNAEFSASPATMQAGVQGATQPGIQPPFQHPGVVTNATPPVPPTTTPLPPGTHHTQQPLTANPQSSSLPVVSGYGVATAPQQQSTVTSIAPPSIPVATNTVSPMSLPSAPLSLPAQGGVSGSGTMPLAASQTVSGLPSLPPTISFPTVAPGLPSLPPTISFPTVAPTISLKSAAVASNFSQATPTTTS